jgi:hypothetical protein
VAPTAITKVVARATPTMHNAVLTFLRNRFRKQNVKSLVANPYNANFTIKVYISIYALSMFRIEIRMMHMKIEKRILTILTISMLLFSTFAVLSRNFIPTVNSSDGVPAELTGTISDMGKDTDGDGKFDYLEVTAEINVSSSDYYRIEVPYLINPLNNSYPVGLSTEMKYLDVGLQSLSLSFYGPKIYADKFNVSGIGEIRLYEDYGYFLGSLWHVPLHTVYNYTDFDCRAVFTGTTYDKGIDTDGDGLFNSLQIGVEVNVTDAAEYEVQVSNLYGNVSVDVYNYYTSFLEPGIQTINVSLSGAKIHASHGVVSNVGSISLSIHEKQDYYYYYYTLQYIGSRPLNRTYSYNEFDPMAFFTGKILDEGIDEDGDKLFDYLEISVEINVTDAGSYEIVFQNLVGNYSNYLYEYQSFQGEFEEGLYFINFTVYGPKIYGAHLNPVYLQDLWLQYWWYPWQWIELEHRSMVPLPSLYNYSEFESYAFLTGKVSDLGVDTDADGLFDYLEVGVEVNVTEAGYYQISVSGLADEYTTWYSQYATLDLDLGVHIINFTFPGPMIAYYHINPKNVTDLYLMEYPTLYLLGYISTTALPTRYNYTQFNSPLTDMQVEFTVYPNATVGVSGSVNQTRIYAPYYYPPKVNATLGFSTSGDVTTGSVNGTMMLPEYPYYYQQFPFNSTTVNFASQYYNGMLNANLNATMQLPPEGRTTYPFNSSTLSLHGTYSNGMLNINLYGETTLPSFIATMFPLNITDATVMADYDGNELNGNITFHALSGFPLGDVVVYFNGNKTEISFTGNINVIYGNYFGMEINATVLEQMLTQINSTIPGQGDYSLYNMTMGMIECTRLNTTMTPFGDPLLGATVDYSAIIRGNFTRLMAYAIVGPYATEETRSIIDAAINVTLSSVDHASLMFDYYYGSKMGFLNLTLTSDVKALWSSALQLIPPKIPSEYRNQTEAFLKIANITADAVENANLDVEYSSDTQQLNVYASLTANITKMKNEIIPILPDVLPPQYRDFVESCTNTTYCTLESLNTTCNYVNGVIDFDAKWLLKGDFKAEINRVKSCFVEYLNLTSPYMINWQIQMINATEIDISNFKADIRLGEDWMTLTFEGLKIHPPKDEIDSVRFKLYRLFNMTSSPYESPREFEKLEITIIGGANATHTVLLYAPPTVPSPDNASLDYKVMIWQNTTLSSLKDLVFQIAYQEVRDYLGKTYYIPIFTNSTVTNFNFDPDAKRISFNVTGTIGTGFCNVTIPRALLSASLSDWAVSIDGTPLDPAGFSVNENAGFVFIYLNYSHSSHVIGISGTWVVTEFQPNLLPLALVVLTLMTLVIAVRQRKRLRAFGIRYQGAIRTFVNRIVQLRT